MENGFLKVAALTPHIKVADPMYNAKQICDCIDEAEEKRAKIMVFPELCITGYTCHDLFLQEKLLSEAKRALDIIVEHSDGVDGLIFVGLPMERDNRLYNVAAVINCGEIMGFVPKTYLPGYGEYYEPRHFVSGNEIPVMVDYDGVEIPFGTNLLFTSDAMEGLCIACEICEDVWVANPPSTNHAVAGANVIVNLSASNEVVGKKEYREMLIKATSARLVCGYIYASAGEGESTQDVVFSGHNLIAENGSILAQARNFSCTNIYSELDVFRLRSERRRMNSFSKPNEKEYMIIPCAMVIEETVLERNYDKQPFVPQNRDMRNQRCLRNLALKAKL